MLKTTFKNSVIEIVVKAGDRLKQYYGKAESLGSKTDYANDVVTKLDKETEEMIYQRLQRLDKTIGFNGEEFGLRNKAERLWILDPIDGTAHFIRGIPFCTTMLALSDNGKISFSMIYNFVTGELFTAERGKGAWRNRKRVCVSNRSLSQSYLSFEANLNFKNADKAYHILRNKFVLIHTITYGYEYGLIAQGKLDGRICFQPYGQVWDYAAGSLLIEEAGGAVTNIGKTTYDYENLNFLMTNKRIYDELTKGSDPLFPISPIA